MKWLGLWYFRSRFYIGIALSRFGERAWAIELVVFAVIASLAKILWVLGGFGSAENSELIAYVWSTLPVLTISNALPMLGATAVLARYAVSDKPAETLKQISEVVEDDAKRFNQERGAPLSRLHFFRKAMRGAPSTLTFFSEGEQLFTPRPYWDGVWFFPTTPPRTPGSHTAHELSYCAICVLEKVQAVQVSKVALVGGKYGGTNGSKWFLEALKRSGRPKIQESITRKQALNWVELAYQSLHYMREELTAHRIVPDVDEARETEFINIFCEYMKWLGFFHAKAIAARWVFLNDRYSRVADIALPPSVQAVMEGIVQTRSKLDPIAAANLPRRATAARVVQVRKGVILPLLGTAATTLICLSLKPLAAWQPDTAALVISYTYSLVAASLASNFVFGLWLLLPPSKSGNRF